MFFKPFYLVVFIGLIATTMAVSLGGCSVNPATGENQFAALMSPQQETRVGAQEHENILRQYGGVVKDPAISAYVSAIGAKLAQDTERPDVTYRFFVLDSPVLNAFALPGGYVYVTRGILALAGSEAELASVLAHEIAHVTARHSAERYSHGVVTSLGASILAAALDSRGASQALGVGSNLYLSSYSRKQEMQADELGIRYLHRAGYDPAASAQFLAAMGRFSAFEAQEAGAAGKNSGFSYFSTHPQTDDRVAQARVLAASYPGEPADQGVERYLKKIEGMIYGDSPAQGFVRDQTFWHPDMNFTFTVPEGFIIGNQPSQIIARDKASGTIILFDTASRASGADAATYLSNVWMKGEPLGDVERITINGKSAATGSFTGRIGNTMMNVRLVAVEWSHDRFYRFQIAMPPNAPASLVEDLKNTTYSLRHMSAAERGDIRPMRLRMATARPGDNVTTLAAGQPFPAMKEQRFRALNNMAPTENVIPGRIYKTIIAD